MSPDEVGRSSPLAAMESYGLGGLAATFSALPRVKKCVVESTWNTIFGSKWGLSSDEVTTAVGVFEKSGNNYRTLLQHLLTKEKAKLFFSAADGDKRFQEMVAEERLTCDEVQRLSEEKDFSAFAAGVFKANCVACHYDGEGYEDSYVYISLFAEDGTLQADADRDAILERILDGTMPQDGYAENAKLNEDQQRKAMQCFLGDSTGTMARQDEDLGKIHLLEN